MLAKAKTNAKPMCFEDQWRQRRKPLLPDSDPIHRQPAVDSRTAAPAPAAESDHQHRLLTIVLRTLNPRSYNR